MSRDSFIQYSQANSGYYQDWHPPIMALVWRIILLIFPFQTGMLILQCLLLFIGLSILIKNTKTSIGRYLFLAMPFYPWIFGISGVIWKDIQLAFTLLITTSLMRGKNTTLTNSIILILLYYASSVRSNGIFAVAPFIFWWITKIIKTKVLITGTLSLFLCIVLVIINQLFNIYILESERNSQVQQLGQLSMDMGYSSLRTGKSFVFDLTKNELRNCYFLADGNMIGNDAITIPCLHKQATIFETEQESWKLLRKYTMQDIGKFYLDNWESIVILRAKFFYGFLVGGWSDGWLAGGTSLDGRESFPESWSAMRVDEWRVKLIDTYMNIGVMLTGMWFRPIISLTLATLIVINNILDKRYYNLKNREVDRIVLISSILYASSYAFVTVLNQSHRYEYWISLAATIIVINGIESYILVKDEGSKVSGFPVPNSSALLPLLAVDVLAGVLALFAFGGRVRELTFLLAAAHVMAARTNVRQHPARIRTTFDGVLNAGRDWVVASVVVMGAVSLVSDPGFVLGLHPGLVVIAGAALIVAWRIGYAVGPQREVLPSRYVIVGTRSQAEVIANELERDFGPGHVVVGFWDVAPEVPPAGCQVDCPAGAGSLGSLVGFESLSAAGAFVDIAAVVIPAGSPLSPEIHSMVFAAAEAGLSVVSMSELREAVSGRVALADASTQVTTLIVGAGRGWGYRVASRARDLFVAFIGLVIMAMLVPIVAVLMRLEGPGPLFVGEERIGRWGRPVTLWRFRTASSVDGAMVGPGDIPRDAVGSTQIGQVLRTWRLDGLPQVWNVLEGVLSLVGPRPDQAGFVAAEEVAETLYRARLSVAPGITGWAQVHSRGALVEPVAVASLEYDLYYLRHRSMYLDSVVILETLFAPDKWRR